MSEAYTRRPPTDYMPGYEAGSLILHDRYAEIFVNDRLARRILIQEYPATEIRWLKRFRVIAFWTGWVCGVVAGVFISAYMAHHFHTKF